MCLTIHFDWNHGVGNKKEKCKFLEEKQKKTTPCWQGFALLDWPKQVRTCPNSNFSSKLSRFGYRLFDVTSWWFCMILPGEAKKQPQTTPNPHFYIQFAPWPNEYPKILKNIYLLCCPYTRNCRDFVIIFFSSHTRARDTWERIYCIFDVGCCYKVKPGVLSRWPGYTVHIHA